MAALLPCEVEDITDLLSGGEKELYGVAMKGYSSPSSGLIVGSSGAIGAYPSAWDDLTKVTVNAAFPNMFDVNFTKASAPLVSRVNTDVDVESIYTFYCEVNYTVGIDNQIFDDNINNTGIDFVAWYDEGGASEFSPVTEDDIHRTRGFNVTWFEGDGGAVVENAIMTYPTPSPGVDEFQLIDFESGGPINGDHYWISIDVYFGPQMRAAGGDGTWNPSGDEMDSAQSFNDADSWNFMIEVYDLTFSSASDKGFEEFGVNKFTNVTVAGNPTGNAPPGSSAVELTGETAITYAANLPYYVNVSVEDLLSGGNTITADNLGVTISGTSTSYLLATNATSEIHAAQYGWGVNFTAADDPLSVWGNITAGGFMPAPQNGTFQHSSWASDYWVLTNYYDSTKVLWYVAVPGATPEGVYTATITVTVES